MIEKDLSQGMFQFFYNMTRLINWDILPMMSKSEYVLLKKVNKCQKENHRLTLSQIAHELNLSSPAISRTLKNVEAKQWIVRKTDEGDRRNSFIELTELGSQEFSKANEIIHNVMDNSLQKIEEEKIQAFFETGDEILQAIRDTMTEDINKNK